MPASRRSSLRRSAWALSCVALCLAPRHPGRAQALPPGDPVAGRVVASVCSACHGMDGIAVIPQAATLLGRDAAYLSRQLLAFRSGERRNPFMSPMARDLTDRQIADVAAYYGGLAKPLSR